MDLQNQSCSNYECATKKRRFFITISNFMYFSCINGRLKWLWIHSTTYINQLSYKKNALNIQEQKKQFSELAFENDIVEKSSYSFQHLNLSGIYNLAFITRTDFDNEVHIVPEQLEILETLNRKLCRTIRFSNSNF